MPEFPEMEHYRVLLEPRVLNRPITQVMVNREKTVNVAAGDFIRQVAGTCILHVQRRAKHLIFGLDSGQSLLLHLMLGGWLYYGSADDTPLHSSQVILNFGVDQLFFQGLRLGYLHLLVPNALAAKLASIGPEPTSSTFTLHTLKERLATKRGVLKTALVDQKCIAGIGNCYADEICFEAHIRPLIKIGDMTEGEFRALYEAIPLVLNRATAIGGYMEFPFYHGDKQTGAYNTHCLVYDRGTEPCPRCGHPIVQTEHVGRKVFYCPECQHG